MRRCLRFILKVYVYVAFQNNESPEGRTLVIQDMPHMAQFVFDFYRNKVHNMMSQQGVSTLLDVHVLSPT